MDKGCSAVPWHFEFYILKCKIFLINFLDELDNFKQKIFYTKWKMKTHELSFTYKFYFNPSSNNVTKISTQKKCEHNMLKAMEHKDIVQHQSIYYTSEAVALTFTSMSNFKTEATRKCCTAPADNFPFCYNH